MSLELNSATTDSEKKYMLNCINQRIEEFKKDSKIMNHLNKFPAAKRKDEMMTAAILTLCGAHIKQ